MKSMKSLILPAILILTACTPTRPQSQTFFATSEGVQMIINVSENRAEVQTTERGTTVGKFRRGLLAEIEVAEKLLCRDVELLEHSEETVNDTTRATITYALANCRFGY